MEIYINGELIHSAKGTNWEKKNHKYVSRDMVNGKWVYYYGPTDNVKTDVKNTIKYGRDYQQAGKNVKVGRGVEPEVMQFINYVTSRKDMQNVEVNRDGNDYVVTSITNGKPYTERWSKKQMDNDLKRYEDIRFKQKFGRNRSELHPYTDDEFYETFGKKRYRAGERR